jgi:hypothetical protein
LCNINKEQKISFVHQNCGVRHPTKRTKNTATKFIENGVSGGDNRSTGVTGSIQCIFNVAAGQDIKDALMIEELLKEKWFYLLKRKMELSASQLGASNYSG